MPKTAVDTRALILEAARRRILADGYSGLSTRKVAEEYLKYLYTPEGQEIIARNYYRPRNAEVAAKHKELFPKLELVTIKDFGGWGKAQKEHFVDGGVFDQLFAQ